MVKHDEHIRFYVEPGKHNYDDMGVEVSTTSYLTLDKTKISPRVLKIPLYLDITKGGIIDEYKSLLLLFYEKGYFSSRGSYFNFDNLISVLEPINPPYLEYFKNNFGGSYRWNNMINGLEHTPILYGLLRLSYIDIIGATYSLQKEVMKSYYEKIKNELIDLGVVFAVLDYKEDTEESVDPQEDITDDTNTDEENNSDSTVVDSTNE